MMIGQEADCRANENIFFHLKIIGDFESMCDSFSIMAYKKKRVFRKTDIKANVKGQKAIKDTCLILVLTTNNDLN